MLLTRLDSLATMQSFCEAKIDLAQNDPFTYVIYHFSVLNGFGYAVDSLIVGLGTA